MNRTVNPLLLAAIAFISGFLSVLIFHQPMLIILKAIALAPEKLTPYAMASTSPFGVPRVFSLAFWGGIWGIVLAIIVTWIRSGLGYWLSGLIIGALGPSLVNWFVVQPLKGEPVGGGWAVPGVATALIVNAAWGLGTVLLFRLLGRNLLNSSQNSTANTESETRERINR
jgi:hypothetical protein